jgi:hypothetical protein
LFQRAELAPSVPDGYTEDREIHVDALDRAVDRKSKAFAGLLGLVRLKSSLLARRFATLQLEDYSLEAEREIRKIIGYGAINLR